MAGTCLLFFAASSLIIGATFYVDPNAGHDGNSGTQGAPFATLSHAFSQASGGDEVRLRRGAVFRESELSPPENIRVTDYGDGGDPRPRLLGSFPVAGWTRWPNNPDVYRSTVTGPIAGLYVNGERMTLARYPNEGWLYTDTDQVHAIFDEALAEHPDAAPNRWVGAFVRWRKWSWWYETRLITGDDGAGNLTFNSADSKGNNSDPDSGYYIDNSLAELDAPGEWFFDNTTDTLYFYPPNGADPNTLQIEAATESRAMNLGGDVIVENIAFAYYTDCVLNLGGKATVRNCVMEDLPYNGIMASWNAGGSLIEDNIIRDLLGVGISWNENPDGASGTIIQRNLIQNAGIVPGQGGSGVWQAAGIIVSNGNQTLVRRNRIEGAGYAGIIFNTNGLIAEQNVIINAMATLNDGAAIYCNAGENVIRENIILETQGDLVSSQPWTPLTHGIWVEFLEEFRDSVIEGNTVYGSNGSGVFLINNFDCTMRGNTLVSNRNRALQLGGSTRDPEDNQYDQGHQMEDNLFVIGAYGWNGLTAFENLRQWPEVHLAAIGYGVSNQFDMDYGEMNGTTIVIPDNLEYTPFWRSDWSYRNLGAWQSEESDWADPDPTMVEGDCFLFINDTGNRFSFPLPDGVTWELLNGSSAGTSVNIEPYRSIVLLAVSGDYSDLPGYFLASEVGQPNGESPPVVSHFFSMFQNDTDMAVEFPLDHSGVTWYLPDGSDPGPFVRVRPRHSRFLFGTTNQPEFIFANSLFEDFDEWISGEGVPGNANGVADDPSQSGQDNGQSFFFGVPAISGDRAEIRLRRSEDPEFTHVLRFPRYKFTQNANFEILLTENPEAPPWNWTVLTDFKQVVMPDESDPYREWVEIHFTSSAETALARLRLDITE